MQFPNAPTIGTREERIIQSAMESCLAKSIISLGAGFALGGVFGLVLSSLDTTSHLQMQEQNLTTRQQIRQVGREMAQRSYSTAKNFAVVAAVYTGVECVIEGWRAKSDLQNSMYAGCVTGAVLAARAGGPKAAAAGCAGFAAFSTAIDWYMRERESSDDD